jgi:AmmeMemoRadiSam system protein A
VSRGSDDQDTERGRVLVLMARETLAAAVGLCDEIPRTEPWLEEPGATFVTLRIGESLRGCIGTLRAWRPLGQDVRANTRAAAFADSRFHPLRRVEYPQVSLEVSLLSPSEPCGFRSEEEAVAGLRPGVDGVIFEYRGHRSTFLPQVWEQLEDPREFLAHLKHKAGLPPAFWDPEVRLSRYTVRKWEEDLLS